MYWTPSPSIEETLTSSSRTSVSGAGGLVGVRVELLCVWCLSGCYVGRRSGVVKVVFGA